MEENVEGAGSYVQGRNRDHSDREVVIERETIWNGWKGWINVQTGRREAGKEGEDEDYG